MSSEPIVLNVIQPNIDARCHHEQLRSSGVWTCQIVGCDGVHHYFVRS